MSRLLLVALLVLVPAMGSRAAPPERIWITLGTPAWQLLQRISPALKPAAAREADASAATTRSNGDTIRVVEVSRAERDALAHAVHRDLHHCAGFMAHDSLDAALRSLRPTGPASTPTRPDYSIDQQPRVLPMLAAMSDTRIGADIQALAAFQNRYYNGSHGADAADWLAEQWQTIAAGRSDIHVDKVYRGGDAMPSVVLSINGGSLADQVLVMGAHLDSVNWKDYQLGTPHYLARAPGADDDASGVAGLTEVLRAMVSADLRPQRSIRLMAYAGEEFGLYGSQYLANDYANRDVDVVGVLQLDMTNYQGSAADIYLIDDYTDSQQNAFLYQLAATYLPSVVVAYDTCTYACSDHASWSAQGYAASFPFEAKLGEDNPWIHTADDDWAHSGSQATNALKFTRLAMAWLGELAFEGDLIFADGFQNAP